MSLSSYLLAFYLSVHAALTNFGCTLHKTGNETICLALPRMKRSRSSAFFCQRRKSPQHILAAAMGSQWILLVPQRNATEQT
jgi:hypothetical protein